MSNWTVEDRLTGEVVHAYGADIPSHYETFPLEQYNHILQKEVIAEPVRTVTKLEYLRRFTQVERIAIRAASTQSPELADYLAMLEIAQDIDLDDPDTVAAVTMLEQAGLIAAGRAAEILA